MAGIFAIIFTLRLPNETYLWREIHNSGHTPLFGAMSLLILFLLKSIWPAANSKPFRIYLLSFIITVAFGGAVEIIQIWTPGEPDIWDLMRDIAGAVSFLGFYYLYESHKNTLASRYSGVSRLIIYFISVASLLAALTPLTHWSGSYIHRNRIFPTICDFNPVWDTRFLYTRNAQLSPVPDSISSRFEDKNCRQITFRPSQYPAFIIEEPFPDWRGYEYFHCSIYSDLDTTVYIGIRIDDFHHNLEFSDRFNTRLKIESGFNNIDIPIAKIMAAPVNRKMDIAEIRSIHIFAVNPPASFRRYPSKIIYNLHRSLWGFTGRTSTTTCPLIILSCFFPVSMPLSPPRLPLLSRMAPRRRYQALLAHALLPTIPG
jgi:hypothetical protein